MVVIGAKARVLILYLAIFFVVNVMLPTVLAQRCTTCDTDLDCDRNFPFTSCSFDSFGFKCCSRPGR